LILPETSIEKPLHYQEVAGKGIEGSFKDQTLKIGSADWVGVTDASEINQTKVYISINNKVKGFYVFENEYREGIKELFDTLKNRYYRLYVLSGDNNGEQRMLERLVPENTRLIFNQKPDDKLNFIKNLQLTNHNVLMIGDGLNDAGALAQSDIGISISE